MANSTIIDAGFVVGVAFELKTSLEGLKSSLFGFYDYVMGKGLNNLVKRNPIILR
jgi:hypothetical protein